VNPAASTSPTPPAVTAGWHGSGIDGERARSPYCGTDPTSVAGTWGLGERGGIGCSAPRSPNSGALHPMPTPHYTHCAHCDIDMHNDEQQRRISNEQQRRYCAVCWIHITTSNRGWDED